MFPSFDFTDPQALYYVKAFGYPSLFILMIVEGPIITLIGSFLASLGFFDVRLIFALSLLGDLLGDFVLYGMGYFGGLQVLAKAEKFFRIGPSVINKLRKLFNNHGKKIIFSVKSTTGLCGITFILAGTLRMNLKSFFLATLVGGMAWSGILTLIGYFFGYAFEKTNAYIKYAGIIISLTVVIFLALLFLYKKYQSKKILENNFAKN